MPWDAVAPRVLDPRKEPGGLPRNRGVPCEVLCDARVNDGPTEEGVDAAIELVADMYLDDLRDKTLRGLEGRALAGFATATSRTATTRSR